MTSFVAQQSSADTVSDPSTVACQAQQERGTSADSEVGESRHISADELERHIASCGYLMERCMADYEQHGDLGSLGSAHRWRILMEQAIKSRSAETVARMERERRLA